MYELLFSESSNFKLSFQVKFDLYISMFQVKFDLWIS